MGSPQRMRKVTNKEWKMIEKVWLEEGLTLPQMASRFGLSTNKIQRYLQDKYGSAKSPNQNLYR